MEEQEDDGAAPKQRVRGPHPRPRRPGRRHRRRAAVGRRLRRGPARPGVPELRLRAHGRAGRLLLPHRRPADPLARADRRAGRADRPGPDAAAPGRRVRRPAPGRLRADQHLAQLRRARARRASRRFPPRAAAHRAGDRARPRAPRAGRCPTPRCSAAFAALTESIGLDVGRRRDPRALRRRGRRGQRRRRRGGLRVRARAERRWPMLRQIEGSHAVAEAGRAVPARGDLRLPDLAPDPHRRGAVARAREVGRAGAVRVRQRRVGVRRDVGGDRRRRPPARAPTRPPPARACSTWPRRSTTPPGSACRS